jgi:hypothetical protein
MDDELLKIRRNIENLRKEMVQTCVQDGVELTHPRVVRLSQLLDKQLNEYDRHVRQCYPGRYKEMGYFPLFITSYNPTNNI